MTPADAGRCVLDHIASLAEALGAAGAGTGRHGESRRRLRPAAPPGLPTKVGTAGRPLPRHPGAQSNRAFAAEQGNAAHTRSASPQPLLAVVRGCEGITGQAETMHSAVGERALPLVTGAPGCRGFYAFRDEADPARAVSVALFTAREDAMRLHEAVVGVTREKPSGTVVLATAQYGR